MTSEELFQRWKSVRDICERVDALVNGSRIIDEMLHDVALVEHHSNERLLTLREASVLSGYSVDHLARLVRQSVIPNAGKTRSPRVRLADLPRRPKRFDQTGKGSYDVNADARSLGVRR
jgi:hypothetical protein